MANTYLVCFEEADNADYQDFVFLVNNVRPVDANEGYGLRIEPPLTVNSDGPEFRSLLEFDNLDGWITYLKEWGRNRDPNGVFSVADGVLRISGEDTGYLRTEEAFESFHLRFEYRWGENSRPPGKNPILDGGVIYYVQEAQVDHIWPRGIEFDLRDEDAGDVWLHAGTTLHSIGNTWGAGRPARVVKLQSAENAFGEWNTAEIFADNGKVVHLVNGMIVNRGTNASVRRGRILIQSAGTEMQLRNIEVRKWRPEPSVAGTATHSAQRQR
jgi:hypothetical protein